MKTWALFSGRFDPPNPGHFLTIRKLSRIHKKVIVPILDYDNRSVSAQDTMKIMEYFFKVFNCNNIHFFVNREHFGRISAAELLLLLDSFEIEKTDCLYYAGNEEVINNIKKIGIIESEYIERATPPGMDPYMFESTKVRNDMKNGMNISDYYGFS